MNLMRLIHRLKAVGSPERVATAGWVISLVFIGSQIGSTGMRAYNPEPNYFCHYGVDCRMNNVVNTRCCRDTSNDRAESKTSFYTCRASCR